jgi:hypothetical protein
MLETSQDLLYIMLSISVLWFTIFLCWLLYQAARILKNANDVVENVNKKVELISDAVEFMRHKVDKVSGHMNIVTRIASTLLERLILNPLSSKLDDALDEEFETAFSNKKRRVKRK